MMEVRQQIRLLPARSFSSHVGGQNLLVQNLEIGSSLLSFQPQPPWCLDIDMSSAQHTPPASPPSMDQAATYPLPATDSGTKDYLFPLEPRPTRLVQFAEEDTLVKVHETWSPDEYDRKCLPFGRLVRRGNEKFVDQDAPRPQPDSSKPRRPFVRTNALRGADFLAAVNMDICDEPPATYASKITQPTPDFDPVSQASAVLLEAMQSRDWDTVVKRECRLALVQQCLIFW